MRRVIVDIRPEDGLQPTEIVADLRNAAELLFDPMRCVAFWDDRTSNHQCPQQSSGRPCPHTEQGLEKYQQLVERNMQAVLEVFFPHAGVHIYLR